jgi:hypothetical protein
MLVDSTELLIRFQPILIVIIILIFMLGFIWAYTKILENRIQNNSTIIPTRRNDEEMGNVSSSEVILPKYVESATQDNAYAPPPYATDRDFCHAVNSGQNGEIGRNFESSAHNTNSDQVNREIRQVAIQLRNITN